MPVYSQHRSYVDNLPKWSRCRDCFEGGDAVKARGVLYLPLLEGHDGPRATGYVGYLTRALFYPAMPRTVTGLTGMVFGKEPTVTDMPSAQEDEFKDVTLTGVSLSAFAQQLCQEVLITGRGGILVDVPDAPTPGSRPYWVIFPAESIVNWRTRAVDGRQVLTMVVLREQYEVESDDAFAPTSATQYRVLMLVDGRYVVTVWRESEDANKKGTWVASEPILPLRRGVPLDYIPFTFVGPTTIEPYVEKPPLLDLADVNLSHFRTSADHEHGAHFTALPTPYVSGMQLEQGQTLAIGSGVAWVLPDANARAGMVEFSGAGLRSLADLKEEKRLLMVTLGARMLETQKKAAEAAATVEMRHAGERSALSVLADVVGQAVTVAARWHLYWDGVDDAVADKLVVKMNPEVTETLSAQDISALVDAWQKGAISHKTVYYNLQWGEWARPDVDFEQEAKDIEAEAAANPQPNLNLPPGVAPQVVPPRTGTPTTGQPPN